MKTDDNKRAILTAIEMQRRLGQLNQEWQTRGWNQFQMGIGINTGRLIVGNIGSTQRMEYTVLGDTVNVSSRLCSVADAGKVIVASTTLEKIGDAFETRLIELPELKGKTQGSVVAYEVVALG
jgi:adenylate cyclase